MYKNYYKLINNKQQLIHIKMNKSFIKSIVLSF